MSSNLFSPFTLRGLTLQNRLVVSPMCQYISEDGCANDWHLVHYGHFSLGAAGLVMTEATNVNAVGRITYKCAGMYSDEQEFAMKRVIDFCKKFGVAAHGIQLAHAGRKASTVPPAQGGRPLTKDEGAWQTVAPSAIPFGDGWHVPKELSHTEMAEIKADFVSAVERSNRVGYDLIEFHAGHGYLIHQFLSPLSNQRTDNYGGPLENRMRFPLEVFAAMRAAWPSDKPMGARVSAVDWVSGGLTVEETVVFARELRKLGCDYVDVSSGQLDARQQIPFAPGFNVPFSEKVRNEADVPTMAVGLITSPEAAEEIVSSGKADFVCIGREAMWNPRFAWHAALKLGAETKYAPKYTPATPAMRPQVFPRT